MPSPSPLVVSKVSLSPAAVCCLLIINFITENGMHRSHRLPAYYVWARAKQFGCHSVVTLTAAGK